MTNTLPPPVLDQQLMEMRWRLLSLAADLDRLDRCGLSGDLRLAKLRDAIAVLSEPASGRAEKMQMLLSDLTPGPR